jgi:hypothetical protein
VIGVSGDTRKQFFHHRERRRSSLAVGGAQVGQRKATRAAVL